jgi:preprotein translocase subunit SecG
MQTVIIVLHLFIVLALIGVVLLQKSEGGALGMGGGGGFLTSRGSANVLTRTTAILAGAFFLTSLLLSIIAGFGSHQGSIFKPTAATVPGAPVPSIPGGGNLLDQMKQPQQPPSGPQVPQSK